MGEEKSREAKISEHLERYGLTTEDALRRMVFPGLSGKAVERLSTRLVESKWLNAWKMPGGGRYFTFGKRAASELGFRSRQTDYFGYQALVGRLGVLYFCAKLGVNVMSPKDFRERYPELCKPTFTAQGYYLDRGEEKRLAYIQVDHGRANTDGVSRKLQQTIKTRLRDGDFAKLIIVERMFMVAIATPSEEKADDIRKATTLEDLGPVHFRVEAVPELIPLGLHRTERPEPQGVKDA